MNAAATGWLLRAWVIALVLTMGWFPAVANSAPGDGGLPAESPTLSLESLGVDSTFAFYGVQGTQNLTVPVPRGLAPTALNVVVEMPPNLRSGVIAVTQDNRVVSRIDLPPRSRRRSAVGGGSRTPLCCLCSRRVRCAQRALPDAVDTGADIATLELEVPNNGDSQPTWRLYRVNKPVPTS